MELQATMALDRDAVNTVLLRLLPPSTAATSSTSWLLLHTIPITASLSRTLSRLVSLEQAVVAAEARSGQTSASRRVNGSRPSSSSPSSSGATSLNGSFAAAAAASPPPPGCIDVVRVGYILSEIHAYCLLLKCRSAAQAARMKAALEEGAALGVTAPVEFVSEAGAVAVTRRSFAEPCEQQHSNNSSTASACGDAREVESPQQHQSSTANHQSGGGRQGQQWHCEVHATTLLDAVTAIYPVRDGAEGSTADDEDDSDCRGDGGEDGYGRRRGERRTSDGGRLDRSAHRSQLHSPHPQAMRRPHSDQAMSAPASPSMQQQQHWRSPPPPSNSVLSPATPTMVAAGPRARGGVAKGAAPGAARPPLTLPSPPAQTGARAHTPLHLPQPCAESGGASPLKLDVATVGWASSSSAPRQRQEPQRSGGGNTRGSSGGRVVGGDPYDEFCAICLVDPLRTGACVTTLCQHVFHLHCYAQLPSSSAECPLCRFSVYDLLNDARCEVCGTYEDLWVCLVCGNVACGRARRDHQQEHYRSSGHSCSWQSSTNRIWNLSSRMFLHQEVALLLDGAEDSSHDEGSAMERLRCMSWAEPLDKDLQEALKESKEEAVAHYYTQFLQQLAEEQRRYYETRQAEQRVRRERRQWQLEAQSHNISGAKSADEGKEFASSSASSCATVHGIVRDERQQRRRILAEYAPAMVGLLQEAQRAYTVMYNSLKATRDDAQQQVLLRSHFNSGLTAQADQLRQRTQDAVRKGQRNAQVKVAEEAALQKKVEDALAAL